MHQSVKNSELPSALIVGVAGFVGSHFAENLLAQNVKVIGIDSLVSGNDHYLDKLKKNKDFSYIEHDITIGLPSDLPKIKYVIHAGAIEEYLSNFDIALDILKVNAQGTTNLLDYVKDNPGTKFMLGSTHNVYAGILSSLNLEHYFGISDRDSKRYAHHEAKRFAEALTAEYYRKYNIDARVIRVAHIYGPRMNLKAATDLSHLIKRAVYDDTLTIYGDGLKRIRPTFIYDVISGMSKALFYEESKGKIYNLVSEQEVTILEAAYAIQRNSTKSLTIQFLPKTEEMSFPSHKIELLQTQKELGWKPKVAFDQGITETLEYLFLEQKKKLDQRPEEIHSEQPQIKESKSTVVLPHIEERITTENSRKQKRLNIQWSHVAQLVLVGISVFVILTIGVLPVAAFYFYTDRVTDYIKAESTQNQNYVNSLLRADTQLNHVEWFYNIAQQRVQLENTRELLNTLVQIQDQQLENERHKAKVAQLYSLAFKNSINPEEETSTRDRLILNIAEIEYAKAYIQGLQHTLLSADGLSTIKTLTNTLSQSEIELKQLHQEYQQVMKLLTSPTPEQVQVVIYKEGKPVGTTKAIRDITGIKFDQFTSVTQLDSDKPTLYLSHNMYEQMRTTLLPQMQRELNLQQYISNWNLLIEELASNVTVQDVHSFSQTLPHLINEDRVALFNTSSRCEDNRLKQESTTSAGECLQVDLRDKEQNIPKEISLDVIRTASTTSLTLNFTATSDGEVTLTLPNQVRITNFEQSIIRGLAEIKQIDNGSNVTYLFPYSIARSSKVDMTIEWVNISEILVPIKTITLPFDANATNITLMQNQQAAFKTAGTRLHLSSTPQNP